MIIKTTLIEAEVIIFMNVDTVGKNKIKIDLSHDEIILFFGGYELIDYENPRSKAVINMLIKNVLPPELLPLDCKKVLIEVFPTKFGCSIYFTKLYNQTKRFRRVSENKIYTLVFENSENMILGAKELFKLPSAVFMKSRLFYGDSKYSLIITTSKNLSGLLLHIEEYCLSISKSPITAAKAEEYLRLIIPQNAISKIASAF